jgi:tetratricopeptide (TPR) repeat protein
MDNSTQNSEQLMRWLDGEMNEQEKQNFEKHLSSDQQLQGELNNLQLAREAIRSYGLRQQVAQVHQSMMKEMKPQAIVRTMSSTRRIIRSSLSIAASVLLIFISVQVYNFIGLSPDKLFKEEYSAFELSTTRDPNVPPESAIEKSYREKNYKTVIDLKNKSTNISTKEQFLAGVSYLELDDPSNAIHSFDTVLIRDKTSGQQTYKDEAEYYLALTYVKNKDYDQALELMNTIHNNPSHIYHEKFSSRFIRKVKLLKWR